MRNIVKVLVILAYISILVSHLIPYRTIDPELAPYRKEFLDTVHQHCTDKQFYSNPTQESVSIKDLKNNEQIAYCVYDLIFSKAIIVYNTRFWYRNSEDERYSTFTHEALHCYFHEGHNDDPNNFMYAYETGIPKEVVKEQLTEYLIKKCGK
jgi:hypothetical protein